jgi:Sulfatase-modifying factor enzyme 1
MTVAPSLTREAAPRGEYRKRTVPVDSFEPNPWGLYNVHGNVFEWAEDCWDASKSGNVSDGRARTTGDCAKRVVRGGSWSYNPQSLRSAYRGWNYASDRNLNLGKRLAVGESGFGDCDLAPGPVKGEELASLSGGSSVWLTIHTAVPPSKPSARASHLCSGQEAKVDYGLLAVVGGQGLIYSDPYCSRYVIFHGRG